MNKKFIAILAAAVILVGGCSKKKDPADDPSSNPSSSPSSVPSSQVPEPPSEPQSSSEDTTATANPNVMCPIEPADIDVTSFADYENEKKGWGQGRQMNDQNRPLTCESYQPKYGDLGALFIMPADEKKMYLTFDNGYENGYTTPILDALKEKDCKAVFFVTMDYVKKNPDLIKRMIDEGHAIGNHTVKHKSMPTISTEEVIEEVTGLHNYMVENYNYRMTLLRPPMGEFSSKSLAIAQALGYKSVLWSYAYLDYDVDKQMGVEAAFPKVTAAAHNGAIYLLHAVSKDNAEMMPDLIDNFRENGYSLELLTVESETPSIPPITP